MRTVRVSVVFTAEEHEALVRKYPAEALASIVRRLAAADVGMDVTARKSTKRPPADPEFREIDGERVRVPAWWWAPETLERTAGGHFVTGDVRQWPPAAFARWAVVCKAFPDAEQWEKLGAWLASHPPKQTLGFRFGMSHWLAEQMVLALKTPTSAAVQRLALLEEQARGRFRAVSPPGTKTQRLAKQMSEEQWRLLGEWLAAGGFNWLWERGEKEAGVMHLEKWGDEMFQRSSSWASAGKPKLAAPRLNGLSTERVQDRSAYQETDAKAILSRKT